MTLMKSILLGSATGLVAVAGAQAADLPTKKAAPAAANYVKVCSIPGGAGFVIPGSETCLQFSGFVAVEAIYVQRKNGTLSDRFGLDGRGSLTFDAYTNTAWGLLQSEARFDGNGGGASVPGNFSTGGGMGLDHAWFHIAGFEGGVAAGSYFNQSGLGTISDNFGAPDVGGKAYLGYTASFGGGFSAGVAIEDATGRRQAATGDVFAGTRYPDLSAKLGVAQTWGSASLSGTIHRTSLDATSASGAATYMGWGVAGAVSVNASSMISVGVTADYGRGISKMFSQAVGNWSGTGVYNFGDLLPVVGGYVAPKTWGIGANVAITASPQLKLTAYATYGRLSYAANPLPLSPTSYKGWNAGVDTTWTPISNLAFDLNVMYEKITTNVVGNNNSGFLGRLQITRSF